MSAPAGLSSCCLNCHAKEPPTGGPLHKCSACSKALYCSAQCQKADWRRHKVLCDFIKTKPVTPTCPPGLDENRKEFERCVGDILMNAAHSALKLDTPDTMHRDHAFVLNLAVTPGWTEGDDPSRRFQPSAAAALPYAYVAQHLRWADIDETEERIAYITSEPPLDAQALAKGYDKQYSQVILYKPHIDPNAHYRLVLQKPFVGPQHVVPMDERWFKTLSKVLREGLGVVPFQWTDDKMKDLLERGKPFGIKSMIRRDGKHVVLGGYE